MLILEFTGMHCWASTRYSVAGFACESTVAPVSSCQKQHQRHDGITASLYFGVLELLALAVPIWAFLSGELWWTRECFDLVVACAAIFLPHPWQEDILSMIWELPQGLNQCGGRWESCFVLPGGYSAIPMSGFMCFPIKWLWGIQKPLTMFLGGCCCVPGGCATAVFLLSCCAALCMWTVYGLCVFGNADTQTVLCCDWSPSILVHVYWDRWWDMPWLF